MNDLIGPPRREVLRARGGSGGPGTAYPAALRWAITRHVRPRPARGASVAAILYSLIESAKLCGVAPKAYLLGAVHAAIAVPGTVTLPTPVPPPTT
jgi:hypothetical protein